MTNILHTSSTGMSVFAVVFAVIYERVDESIANV